MDEVTLANKCIDGDQRAQRKLFEMYAPWSPLRATWAIIHPAWLAYPN